MPLATLGGAVQHDIAQSYDIMARIIRVTDTMNRESSNYDNILQHFRAMGDKIRAAEISEARQRRLASLEQELKRLQALYQMISTLRDDHEKELGNDIKLTLSFNS